MEYNQVIQILKQVDYSLRNPQVHLAIYKAIDLLLWETAKNKIKDLNE